MKNKELHILSKEYFENYDKWSDVILELNMNIWDETKKIYLQSKENLMNSFLFIKNFNDVKLIELIRCWKVAQGDYDTSKHIQGMKHKYTESERIDYYHKSERKLRKYIEKYYGLKDYWSF